MQQALVEDDIVTLLAMVSILDIIILIDAGGEIIRVTKAGLKSGQDSSKEMSMLLCYSIYLLILSYDVCSPV